MPPYPRELSQQVSQRQVLPVAPSDDEAGESADDLPNFQSNLAGGSIARPASGVSRYRTPMGMSAGVPATYTPPVGGFTTHPTHGHQAQHSHQPSIPSAQPLPRYTTPSAFSPPTDERNLSSASPSIPSSFPTTSLSYPAHLSHSQIQPYAFRGPISANNQPSPIIPTSSALTSRSQSGQHLEHAVESVQASLAALRERLDGLETHTYGSNPSLAIRQPGGASSPAAGNNGGASSNTPGLVWDPHSMGLWSVVFVPATHLANQLKYILILILSSPASQRQTGRSSSRRSSGGIDVRAILRRLVLDASFVLAAFAVSRAAWRASGIRRREVLRALQLVWVALIGRPAPRRVLVDRGV